MMDSGIFKSLSNTDGGDSPGDGEGVLPLPLSRLCLSCLLIYLPTSLYLIFA